MSDVEHGRALAIIQTRKALTSTIDWAERSNHVGHLLSTGQLEDDTGAIIPGLTIQLEVKRAVVVDRCLYDLGIFTLEKGVRRRVYQLNVTPPNKLSHNGITGQIFGPHEHIGDKVFEVSEPGVTCGGLPAAFAFFCSRANIHFTGTFESPL